MNGDSSPIVAALYAIAAKIGPTTLFQTPTELTISAGEVTATRNFHTIDTEADAASDNLDTIAGGSVGRILLIRAENDARTVVVKHSTGNIWLKEKVDLSLDDIRDGILLIYDGTKWIDLGGAINLSTAVLKSLFDANTVLAANTDDTPAALTVAEQRLVGRITAGNIAALTAAQVRTLINVEDGATADQSGAEILALLGLIAAEVAQIANIDTVTISVAQWGALGALVEWTAWTPTLTGDADLSAYTHARYFRLGNICFFEFSAANKNVTTSGYIQITLPFTHADTGTISVSARVNDGSAWIGAPHSIIPANVNYMNIYKTAAAGSWAGTETGVYIHVTGFFEIA